jgi:hypothetical protein
MKDHLSEMEIQQYALEGENCPEGIRAHINACETCAVKAANYRLIFTEVSRAPLPELPVLPSTFVLPVLQKKAPSPLFLPLAAAVIIFVPCWLFRKPFLYATEDIPAAVLYLVLAALLFIGGLRAVGMVMRHRRLLKNLDLS